MAPTISGYVYWADIYCPACTIKEVRENHPESTSPSFGDLGTVSTSIEAGDKCGRCGEGL